MNYLYAIHQKKDFIPFTAPFRASAAAPPTLATAAVAAVPRPAAPTTKRDKIIKRHPKTPGLHCLLFHYCPTKKEVKNIQNMNLSNASGNRLNMTYWFVIGDIVDDSCQTQGLRA